MKITFSVRMEQELVNKLDDQIDGLVFRSRSQLIEYLVSKGIGTFLEPKDEPEKRIQFPLKGVKRR